MAMRFLVQRKSRYKKLMMLSNESFVQVSKEVFTVISFVAYFATLSVLALCNVWM